jgi:hypothetical protein
VVGFKKKERKDYTVNLALKRKVRRTLSQMTTIYKTVSP